MHQEEKPAYIMAMVACANAEIAAMQLENQIEARAVHTPDDFRAVIERYGIHHNAVIELLRS